MDIALRPGEAIVWRWGQVESGEIPRGTKRHAHLPLADL